MLSKSQITFSPLILSFSIFLFLIEEQNQFDHRRTNDDRFSSYLFLLMQLLLLVGIIIIAHVPTLPTTPTPPPKPTPAPRMSSRNLRRLREEKDAPGGVDGLPNIKEKNSEEKEDESEDDEKHGRRQQAAFHLMMMDDDSDSSSSLIILIRRRRSGTRGETRT